MKNLSNYFRFALIAILFVAGLSAGAQSSYSILKAGSATRDTVAASETGTLNFSTGTSLSTYQRAGNISVSFLKISGAPAATAKLYGSNDNSNWFIASDSIFTVANSAGDQNTTWTFGTTKTPAINFKYYKVAAVASGATQSFSMRGTSFFMQ